MSSTTKATHQSLFLARENLSALFQALHEDGYEIIGPTLDQEAIVYDRIKSVADLPQGWTDIQEPGRYRLQRREDDAVFGYVVGPHSWKRYLFPPDVVVSEGKQTPDGWQFYEPQDDPPKRALLGVRACELAALRIQDRVFLGGSYIDPIYQRRRVKTLVIAVNCTQAASTCFCSSMNTGHGARPVLIWRSPNSLQVLSWKWHPPKVALLSIF